MMNDYVPEHRAEEPADDPIIGDAPPQANTLFSNRVYNILKWVAQVFLPGLALFYIAIAPLWGFPKQEEVTGTIVAIDLLLGSLLGLSSRQYANSDARFDGQVVVTEHDDFSADVRFKMDDTAPLAHKDEVVFKVKRP